MSQRAIIITISATLSAICLALLAALVVFVSTSHTYATQLENIYKRNLYELSTNINDIEVDISKLVATNAADSQQEILTNIYQSCVLAGNNLSSLPISTQNTSKLNTYINQLGGYIYTLIQNANNKNTLSQQQYDKIIELHAQAEIMSFELNNYMQSLNYNYNILKNVNFNNYNNDYLSNVGNILGTSSKVPSLIYDGPFSDSVMNKEIKGLPQQTISEQQAADKLRCYFDDYSIKYLGEGKGNFEVYNYQVSNKYLDYYMQVTKRGGFILNITASSSKGDNNFTVAECEQIAESFAKILEVNDMKSVWAAASGTTVYVNLAPVINDVIYYPDLIKVKVDKQTGNVIGWEATNFCYNHVERQTTTPVITLQQAQSLLNKNLTVKASNLAIIPNKFVGESMAYEFVCSWDNYTYYVYLSVQDGRELNILRIVSTNTGDLML